MRMQGDLAGARVLQEAVLEGYERTLSEDHLDLLRAFGPDASPRGPLITMTADSPLTFAGLLFDQDPNVILLVHVKEFAKTQRVSPHAYLPQKLATLLYLLSIAAALVQCAERITSLEDEHLINAFQWGLKQSWIDDNCAALLSKAVLHLKN